MASTFDSLPWHDTELLELSINRRKPGTQDEVCLAVVWPTGNEAKVYFRDCYAMSSQLNFGVIADELIADASEVENDSELLVVRDRWRPLGLALEALRCYRIETASTGSVIKIFAERFEVE